MPNFRALDGTTTPNCTNNNVEQCCVLLRPCCSGMQTVQQLPTTRNNMQQGEETDATSTSWKTLGVVSTCWSAMLRPLALCTGLSKWQAINSLPKSRRVRTSSRKKNTCGLILVSKHLIFSVGVVAYGKFESVINCVRLLEAKRRGEAKYIFKDLQFNDSRRLHELGLRSTDLPYNHIRIII